MNKKANKIKDKEEMEHIILQTIIISQNARALAKTAIINSQKNDFNEAYSKLFNAQKKLSEAHKVQMDILQKNRCKQLTLSDVNSQDHLMTAIIFVDLAKDFVDLYERIYDLEITFKIIDT